MREPWYITNIYDENADRMHLDISVNTEATSLGETFRVHIDGYVIPRMAYFEEFKHLGQTDLIKTLFNLHGKQFVNFVKGVFCIVILTDDGFLVFTDTHNVNNYFVYQQGFDFIVSNSLSIIASRVNLEADYENAAIFTLLSHFLDDGTAFKNLSSSTAGSFLEYHGLDLLRSSYWSLGDVLDRKRDISQKPYSHYAEQWETLIGNYLEYLDPRGVSLTVTAGNDSRMVLAALLALDTPAHGFTFGNPQSYESVVSREIAKACNMEHSDYFVDHPTAEWLDECADELMEIGNSTVSLQRAHRYDAYNLEHKAFPDNDMIFTGLMGGEYIKKPPRNSPALHPLLFEAGKIKDKKEFCDHVTKLLQSRAYQTGLVDLDEVCRRLIDFTDHAKGCSTDERSFIYLYLYYGCSHHTQESRILGHFFKYLINPFMDIDFIHLLAGYRAWYVNCRLGYNRLFHSEFLVAITHILAPQLSNVPYGKRGQYTAQDMLFHKIKYTLSRIRYLFYRERDNYPNGFVIGSWMYDFSKVRLLQLRGVLNKIFYLDQLTCDLEDIRWMKVEEDWQRIANPINMGMSYERYCKTKNSNS